MANVLEQYWRKRDFKRTSEPAGKRQKARPESQCVGGLFVIHKHDARRLHYDLRLEHNGVLWSWAVTRGPELLRAARDQRSAVHVKDHSPGLCGVSKAIFPGVPTVQAPSSSGTTAPGYLRATPQPV